MAEEKAVPLSHRRKSETRQKQRRITFRVTDAEFSTVESAATGAGLTVGTYIRDCVLKSPETARRRRPLADVAALSALHAQMRRVGGNLNQIARGVNTGEQRVVADLPEALSELQQLMRRVRLDMGLEA